MIHKIQSKAITLLSLTFILLFSLAGCKNDNKVYIESDVKSLADNQHAPGYNQYENSKITVVVFKVDSIETNGSRGWGYDIMIDNKMYIHQPNVPAVMGNNGFPSEDQARKAGEFIMYKIKNNIIPPSVTPEELDSLGVLD